MPDDEYPEVPKPEECWELRFTARALDDIGCPRDVDPGSMPAVRRGATHKSIVDEFVTQRTLSLQPTQGYLHSVGPGVAALHGPAGGRAATWFDTETGVCWFVGFTPNHDYGVLEDRAAVDELLPSPEDEQLLELFRLELDFASRIRTGLNKLVQDAAEEPGNPHRGMIGGILQLEVTATVVPLSESDVLADVYLAVRLPLEEQRADVPEWPGNELLERLVELVDPAAAADYSPQAIPTPDGTRPIDYASEMVVVARSVTLDASR